MLRLAVSKDADGGRTGEGKKCREKKLKEGKKLGMMTYYATESIN